MAHSKFYVVWTGFRPGIYASWEECRLNIEGFEQPRYQAFLTESEAKTAFEMGYNEFKRKKNEQSSTYSTHIIKESISVDAACSGNPGAMEYRGVVTSSQRVLFHKGPFPVGTNNIGEFLALVHALALQKQHGTSYPIYTDSVTAMSWVKNKNYKTKLPRNEKTEQLFQLLDRAVIWLKGHKYDTPILKWNTEEWGEIPADFGRKG